MSNIKLIDITVDNWVKICFLNPGIDGREFVATGKTCGDCDDTEDIFCLNHNR